MKKSPEGEQQLRSAIRNYILFFIFMIVTNGILVFPAVSVLGYVNEHLGYFPPFLRAWLSQVYLSVKTTTEQFPFLSYGTDWLAFAHLVIALVFIGPLRDPIKNIWIIQWAMISCLCVFPLVLIAGPIRGIPFYWQMIDCFFGAVGFVLLYLCYKRIIRLKSILD